MKLDSGADVVALLKAQHEQVKGLFQQVITTMGSQRTEAFNELRRLLAVHETAEEEIVHPRAREVMANGDQVVEQRLAEERAAKETLGQLEDLDIESTQFETAFRRFQKDVLAHAEAEERLEFVELSAGLDRSQLERMRKAYALAERVAPTHPHAGVESQAANLVTGPFVAMLDRAHDLISH
jgi:hemerythrin superfamily protein